MTAAGEAKSDDWTYTPTSCLSTTEGVVRLAWKDGDRWHACILARENTFGYNFDTLHQALVWIHTEQMNA